jgi:hypothetical protein
MEIKSKYEKDKDDKNMKSKKDVAMISIDNRQSQN